MSNYHYQVDASENREVVRLNPDGSYWIAEDITDEEMRKVFRALVRVAASTMVSPFAGIVKCSSCGFQALLRASDCALVPLENCTKESTCCPKCPQKKSDAHDDKG